VASHVATKPYFQHKVVADIPGPNQRTLEVLVSTGSDHGKFSTANAAATNGPFLMALEVQANIITHIPLDKPLGEVDI
jgi:hypothetical protein